MTQYQSKNSSTTTTDPADRKTVQDRATLERQIGSLEDRVNQQNTNLLEMQRMLRKLQNEVRVAVNALNSKNRG